MRFGKDWAIILIMPAYFAYYAGIMCLMFLVTYYTFYYAGIISLGLSINSSNWECPIRFFTVKLSLINCMNNMMTLSVQPGHANTIHNNIYTTYSCIMWHSLYGLNQGIILLNGSSYVKLKFSLSCCSHKDHYIIPLAAK